jgi:hypothetical protein
MEMVDLAESQTVVQIPTCGGGMVYAQGIGMKVFIPYTGRPKGSVFKV